MVVQRHSPEVIAEAKRVHAAHMELCRRDINAFTEYVLRDEVTGQRVKQAPIHLRIQALAKKHKRLGLLAMPGCGKTQQCVALILFMLGNNPRGRYAIVAQSQKKAKSTLATIARYIEKSADLHQVFPNLKPGEAWSPEGGSITVQRDGFIRDPSVIAYGIEGDITGSRVDGLVVDDILSEKNTRTPGAREKTYQFAFRVLWDRVEKPHGWVIFLGNAWHPDDLLHRLEKGYHKADKDGVPAQESSMDWHVERIRVLDEQGNPTWPERFPLHVIEGMKEEFGPLEFARKYMCEARSEEDARFKRAYIERACQLGSGLHLASHLTDLVLPAAWGIDPYDLREAVEERLTYGVWNLPLAIAFGVDIGVAKTRRSDRTTLVGGILHKPSGQRLLTFIRGGKWDFDEICQRILMVHEAFRPDLLMVESIAAQAFVVQHLQKRPADLNLRPFFTTDKKWDPVLGVEALAGAMAMGRWAYPVPRGTLETASYDTDLARLIEGELYFSPTKHTDDYLMAKWFAEMALRSLATTGGGIMLNSLSPESARQEKLEEARRAAGATGPTIDWAAEERLERERAQRIATHARLNASTF